MPFAYTLHLGRAEPQVPAERWIGLANRDRLRQSRTPWCRYFLMRDSCLDAWYLYIQVSRQKNQAGSLRNADLSAAIFSAPSRLVTSACACCHAGRHWRVFLFSAGGFSRMRVSGH